MLAVVKACAGLSCGRPRLLPLTCGAAARAGRPRPHQIRRVRSVLPV